MSRTTALCALLLLAALACAGESDPGELRAARLEQQLLASCSCHPKKIAGLPLEREIREAIAAGIAGGDDDGTILWSVLQSHGTALLSAGIEDVELRARAVIALVPLCLFLGAAALLLQLRRA